MDNQMMQQPGQQPLPQEPKGSPNESQVLGEGEVQATEEEQSQLEQAFNVALEMIHAEGKSGDGIANIVLDDQDVTEGVGKAVATTLIGVEKKLGGLPDDVKMQLAQEILAELAGLAVQAGALSEDEVTDDWIDKVVSVAYSNYLTNKESMGELDQGELEASVSEAEQYMGTSTRGQQPGQAEQPAQPQPKPTGLLGQA